MTMARESTQGNEVKESRTQKRQRLSHDRSAKVAAKRYVFPLTLVIIAGMIGFFIWRFGWNGMSKSASFDASNWEDQLSSLSPEMLEKLKQAAASGDYGDLLQDQDNMPSEEIDLDEAPSHGDV